MAVPFIFLVILWFIGLYGALPIALIMGVCGLFDLLSHGRHDRTAYSVALIALTIHLILLALLTLGMSEGGIRFWPGLPALVVITALAANTAWGRQQLGRLSPDLEDEERRRLLERIGLRLWLPLMGVVVLAGACEYLLRAKVFWYL